MVPDLDVRPCGVCRALVSTDTGCRHWRPGIPVGKRLGWARGPASGSAVSSPEVAQEDARLADFARLLKESTERMGLTDR